MKILRIDIHKETTTPARAYPGRPTLHQYFGGVLSSLKEVGVSLTYLGGDAIDAPYIEVLTAGARGSTRVWLHLEEPSE